MTENSNAPGLPDPFTLGRILAEVSVKTQPLIQDFFRKYNFQFDKADLDPMNMRETWAQFMGNLMSDPERLVAAQAKFWQDWMQLWQPDASPSPPAEDKRFKAPEWNDNPFFDFLKRSYLMTSKWAQDVVGEAHNLDEETRARMEFQTRQFVNAMAPSNFLLTNPEALKETIDTNGENLIRGMKNLLEDLERGQGKLKISTTDYGAFKLGENIAATPGKVVYQNDLMQLIQYEAATDKVFKTPLLIVPPWINKYYILDLKPKNSFVKWLTEQGYTVFIVSWVNPDRRLARKRFEDYMQEGIIDALDRIKAATGEPDCNVVGYCLGGTLLAVTLAWLSAKKQADRIKSATFLTALVDFSHAGELKMFTDDAQLAMMEREMEDKGFLPASWLRQTFSLLRSNDLIWSFVVNNYLMGKEPFPFDLLYWNDDSTNMPAAMNGFYLRKCYRDNALVKAGEVVMEGIPIDMGKIQTPSYFLSAKDDHIAPWKATYATTRLFNGPMTFTLAASGHVAGVVNPPAAEKYGYWSREGTPEKPDLWLKDAEQNNGSWWPHWEKWLRGHSGEKVPARKPGGGKLKAIEDAPGSYVRVRAD